VNNLAQGWVNYLAGDIQNSRELMLEYLRAIEAKGLDLVNQTIGKEVKKAYQLTNI